jgi:hypothetical protein
MEALVISKIIRKMLSNKKLHKWLKKNYHAHTSTSAQIDKFEADIPEILELTARGGAINDSRLNLIVPALSLRHVFGGIATALNFFHELLPDGMDARIIITDEVSFSHANNENYINWKIQTLQDEDCKGLTIVCAGDRYQKKLALRNKDVFIATAWWTAIIAQKLIDEQKELYNSSNNEKFIYLIQDFEPGFYPWSSRYALAESTYRNTKSIIPVFNTSILKNYFDINNYKFNSAFVFEPVLNEGLRACLSSPKVLRQRKIIVYGRPSVSRNIFEVLIMSLRLAVSSYDFSGWSFYSAGEAHGKIDLGQDFELLPLGKLSLSEYGQLLNTAYAGVSLMVSPHPSYPPLEMSAFGIKVITNNYANKRLADLSQNIYAVDFVSPSTVAGKLIDVVKNYDSQNLCVDILETEFMTNFVEKKNSFKEISPEIRRMIFGGEIFT